MSAIFNHIGTAESWTCSGHNKNCVKYFNRKKGRKTMKYQFKDNKFIWN